MARRMSSLLKLAHVPLSLIIPWRLRAWWQVRVWFPLWLLLRGGGVYLSQGLPMTPPQQRLSGGQGV